MVVPHSSHVSGLGRVAGVRGEAMKRLILALIGAVLVGVLFLTSFQGSAQAEPLQTLTVVEPIEWDRTLDSVAIRGILEAHRSPIPWATVAAYKYNNPSFDVAGFLLALLLFLVSQDDH